MVTGHDVQGAVYNFMLSAMGGEPAAAYAPSREDAALALFASHRTLRAETVAAWPPETRSAARQWLTLMVMFSGLNPNLEFPSDFLTGTTAQRLGEPVLAYILQHSNDLLTLDPKRRAPPPM